MNNKIIPIIVVVVVFLVAILGGFALMNKQSDQKEKAKTVKVANEVDKNRMEDTNEMDVPMDENSGETSMTASLTDLLKLEKPMKCTFDYSDQGVSTKGTTYVSGKKIKGDFDIMNPDNSVTKSYIVSDGEWTYIWTSNEAQGFKMKYDEEMLKDFETQGTDATNEQVKAMQEKVDYKCSIWIPNSSAFEVPSNVEFVDFSAMFNTDAENTGQQMDLCAACNFAQSEADKAECKKSLGCE